MTYFEKQYKRFHKIVFKLFRLSVKGLENIPENRSMIVCANHTSLYDPIVIIAATELPIRYMAKAELFKIPLLKGLIESFGAYPVKRGSTDVSALKKTVSLLKNGDTVGIFPQGTRYSGQKPTPEQAKSGLGLTAYRSGAAVLPIYIKTKKNKVKMFSKTEIVVGKPISNEELRFTDGSIKEIDRASRYAFSKVCELAEDEA